MSTPVEITPLAREDIIELADHIARDSITSAERFLDAVEAACAQLAQMPELGTVCRFQNPKVADVRVWSISRFENHLIFYQPKDNGVLIVRVLHGVRNWQELFEA